MWQDNNPPVAASRSLGDDEFLAQEMEFNTDYTSSLFETQHMHDLTNPAFYSNPPPPPQQQQAYQFHINPATVYYADGGSPTYVPLSPSLSPLPTLTSSSSSYTVPSPSSMPSPTSPESPQPYPSQMLDIKPAIFLHSKEKKSPKKASDIEQWAEYINPTKAYSDLYDSHNLPVSKDISIRTRITADNLEYSHVEDAHIMYRQNQFSLEIDFIGELAQYSTDADEIFHLLKRTSAGSALVPVERLMFYIYAVKHQRAQPFDTELVELTQACGARNQKDTKSPSVAPIANGRAVYSKLQFRSATLYNARTGKTAQNLPNPQQQFYRIIIALVAKTSDSLDFVCTRISPFLIVRGQNPGRFKPLPPIPSTPAALLPPSTPLLSDSSATVTTKRGKNTARKPGNKRARVDSSEDAEEIESPIPVPSPDAPVHPAATHAPAPAIAPAYLPVPAQQFSPPVYTPPHVYMPSAVYAPPPPAEPTKWAKGISNDTVCIAGKVGINTPTPTEALSVIGNIMLTGDIIKPSDQRVKTNIQPVNTASQLANIEALQIYDYELVHGKAAGATNDLERGIMAQQLQQILPSATRTVNNVTMADGAVVEELIVVQDRALLFENIGATKELSSMIKKDQETLQSIDQKFEGRIQGESIAAEKTLTAAEKLLDYIRHREVEKNDETHENVCCVFVASSGKGFYGSLFGLGPAWTLYMLGFFCPLLWFFGSFFVLSHSKSKKVSGSLHMITFFLVGLIGCLIYLPDDTFPAEFKIGYPLCIAGLGFVGVLVNGLRWNWTQNMRLRARSQLRRAEAKTQRLALMRAAKPGKVILKTTRKSKSSKSAAYVSIPMEELSAQPKGAARVVSAREDARAIANAINAKRAVHAETEWERNVLLGQTNSVFV